MKTRGMKQYYNAMQYNITVRSRGCRTEGLARYNTRQIWYLSYMLLVQFKRSNLLFACNSL